MKPRILITGASGFVGYHLISAAYDAGMEIHAAIRSSSNISHLQHFNLRYVIPDYTDQESLCGLLEEHQYDYIIHAAGTTKARTGADYDAVNAMYTLNLAQAAQKAAIPLKKFVFISSLAALGPVAYNAAWPVPDGADANPVTLYGKSKLRAEKYLATMTALPWIVLRPTAVYGPLEKDLFVLFKTFKKGFEFHMGKAPQQLSFVYVKDLADAVMLALTSPSIQTGYNISDGHSYSRYALADISRRIFGVRMVRIHVPLALAKPAITLLEKMSRGIPLLNNDKLLEVSAPSWNCNIQQIKRDLGYNPVYNLEKGMKETIEWYTNNKWF
jgi:nucleoside-diphosphate-sugar epimerase